ncbi:hypothetical protein [Alloactinosynnema sp. L-07]|nr:hypothetical protein [Alloactinosynnema sp. L-07]
MARSSCDQASRTWPRRFMPCRADPVRVELITLEYGTSPVYRLFATNLGVVGSL